MGCRSKIELSVWQVVFLVTLALICTVFAVVGWFRTIDPAPYNRPSNERSTKLNNVTSVVDVHKRLFPFLDHIGSSPKLNNPDSYIQWTFLQMNDVYELIPLSDGKKGGLARVATIRKLLLRENPNTITVLAGDIVSPSALGNSQVNGSMLNGKQMIATFNVLGLDYATLGNHEFDLNETELRCRLNESRFEWIASNVYEINSTKPFHNVLPYKIITIANIKVLMIGLTIDDNTGLSKPYVRITRQKELPEFTANFTKYLRNDLKLTWDVLICLTHLNKQNDIEIVEKNPDIDVLMGGHEHENYYLKRGLNYTPIYKADDNAFSVFIHRFAYRPNLRQLLIFSKLVPVSPRFPEDDNTAAVAKKFYNDGLEAYRKDGYDPDDIVCVLPTGVSFDGRSAIIRTQQTALTEALCKAMMMETNTTICVFNSGAIRVDDQLIGTINQYDVLRCLPFPSNITSLNVRSATLVKILDEGLRLENSGMFISYAGVKYNKSANTWFLENTQQSLNDETLILRIATIPYFVEHTDLRRLPELSAQPTTHSTMTRAFIKYLKKTCTQKPKELS